MARLRTISSLAGAVVALLLGPPAFAQSAVSSALGAPTQAKVAAPAPVPTVKAGEGGGALAKSPQLEEAIASCDAKLALSLGADPQDALRALTPGLSDTILAGSAAWVRAPDGQLRLAFLTTSQPPGRAWFSGEFGDYVPPGGVASLPTMDEVFPPPPAVPGSVEAYARWDAEMKRVVATGVSAQAAAEFYLTLRPEMAKASDGTTRPDPAQASYYERADGTVGLSIPGFSREGPYGGILINLPGFTAASGLPGMRKAGEEAKLKLPAWAAELAVIPPRPPRPTRC